MKSIEEDKRRKRGLQFQTEPWMRELNNEERQQVYHMFMKLPEKHEEDDEDEQEN